MNKLLYFPVLLIALVLLSSHDMYLKLNDYYLEPFTQSTVELFNGTFDKSDNVIDRDRMIDVSIIQNGSRIHPTNESWFEKNSVTFLNFETKNPGTYVIGLSTRSRKIEMDADAFNDYLKHDGVLDLLVKRESEGTLGTSAIELYSKHVKTILQVGLEQTDDWMTSLDYPIEFIPLQNPYDINEGQTLSVQLYFKQAPLVNQLVYLGYKASDMTHTHDGSTHTHKAEESNEHNDLKQYRTNENGIIQFPIDKEGVYYLRTIHLVELENSEYTHESNWATLTFAVGKGHVHENTEDPDQEFTAYYWFVGSIILITVLFFYFRSQGNEE